MLDLHVTTKHSFDIFTAGHIRQCRQQCSHLYYALLFHKSFQTHTTDTL